MRDHPDDAVEQEDFDSPDGDSFEDLYQGEVSKSGLVAIAADTFTGAC
jgi:DNA-directed RNA polymerase subunit omega